MNTPLTPNERVTAAIHLEKPDRTPVAALIGYSVAKWAGVTIADYMFKPEVRVPLMRKAFEDLGGWDYHMEPPPVFENRVGAFNFMPVKVQRPGIELPADSSPQFEEREVMLASDYALVLEKGWARFVREDLVPRAFTAEEIAAAPANPPNMDAEGDKPYYRQRNLFIFEGAYNQIPFEYFSLARSCPAFVRDLYRQPDKVIAAADAMIPELIAALQSMRKTADAPVSFGANRCSSGFLSAKQFEKFALPYWQRLLEPFAPTASSIYLHLDQSWTRFLPYFKEFPKGHYILHFDSMTDMAKAKEVLGENFCLMGDVPPSLLSLGTPDQVRSYCTKLIDSAGKGGGLILSPGCCAPDHATFENVKAMIDVAQTYPIN
jgi:uroporphyrinogen-III decarboxylase